MLRTASSVMRTASRPVFSLRLRKDKTSKQMGAAIAFVVVAFLSFVALAGWRAWEERRSELEQAQIATNNLARSLAQHMQDAIKVADALLTGVVEKVENEGTGDAALNRLHVLFERHVQETPQFHGLFLFDEEGHYLASSYGILPMASNINRDYFQHHLRHPGKKAYIGPPIRSRTTTDWIVTVSKRIDNRDGSFAGVAVAAISMEYFRKFHEDFDIGQHGVMFVAFDDGLILSRHPFKEDVIGVRIPQSIINPVNFSTRPTGSFTARSRIDGMERIYGYRYLDGYPLVAAVGLSREDVLAKWRTAMLTYASSLLALGLILGLLGWRLFGAIRAGLRSEKSLIETQASLMRMNRTLESMALQDALTGIANRRQFDSVLASEYKRALRTGMPLAVMMVDVDFFKQFNDIYGHPEGDRCLRQVSEVLTRTLARAGDLAARYGGEEFAVLLPNTDLGSAELVAHRLCEAIEAMAIPHQGSPFGKLTVSVGVASLMPNGVTAHDMRHQEHLVNAADQALYIAKRNGRNQVCATDRHISSLFSPEDESA